MEKQEHFERNKAADPDKKNDPALRDDSALQPGASTISKADKDWTNQEITRTTADSFRTNDQQKGEAPPDPSFDDIDSQK